MADDADETSGSPVFTERKNIPWMPIGGMQGKVAANFSGKVRRVFEGDGRVFRLRKQTKEMDAGFCAAPNGEGPWPVIP